MGGKVSRVVRCPEGILTQVVWSSFLFKTYEITFDRPGVRIYWERNSSLLPWHTSGLHDTGRSFGATVAGAYCNFWFRPHNQAVVVTWSG